MDTDQHFFSTNEPVWLRVSVVNEGDQPAEIMLLGTRDQGVSIEGEPSNRSRVRRWIRPVETDYAAVLKTVEPKAEISLEVLLNEYLEIEAPGEARFTMKLRIGDRSGKKEELERSFQLSFAGPMGPRRTQDLLTKLESELQSGKMTDRLRAVKSLGAIHTPSALAMMGTALSDESEEVQLTALDAMSFIDVESIHDLLVVAEKSRFESVRWKADAVGRSYGTPKLE